MDCGGWRSILRPVDPRSTRRHDGCVRCAAPMSGSSLEITLPGSQLHQTVLLDRIDPSVGLVRRFEIELLAFDHLEEVSMLYHDPEILIPRHVDARNTDDVLSLFYLPSIKSITATMDNPIVFAWPGENPPTLPASHLSTWRWRGKNLLDEYHR